MALRINSHSRYVDNLLTVTYESENGLERRERALDRYCPECGKKVCSYKDPRMKRVWCYAHDHLTPWTKEYIVGSERANRRMRRHIDNWTGKGRGCHGQGLR